MRQIGLTQGKVALVSNKDYSVLRFYKWYAHFDGRKWYAQRRQAGPRNICIIIKMHQQIVPCDAGFEVDHRNSDGLDNRRCNLRKVTHEQNTQNRSANVGFTTKGISKQGKKYKVRIGTDGIRKHLGMFPTKKEAIAAYNKAAKKYHGRFARLIKTL